MSCVSIDTICCLHSAVVLFHYFLWKGNSALGIFKTATSNCQAYLFYTETYPEKICISQQ